MGERRILAAVILVGVLWLVLSPFLGGVGAPEIVLWLVVLVAVIVAGVRLHRVRARTAVQ